MLLKPYMQGFLAATHTNSTIEEGLPLESWTPTGYATYWSPSEAARGVLAALSTANPVRKVGSPGYGVKNPRGPITPKRMANGQYLLLYYNNAGSSFGQRYNSPPPLCHCASLALHLHHKHSPTWSTPWLLLFACSHVHWTQYSRTHTAARMHDCTFDIAHPHTAVA